ncbi:MAG: hypothetical protein M3O61_09825 [Gemmatimonadota bacterium]|nr:hypothetical protein [Gemmatimonadota bacterium]
MLPLSENELDELVARERERGAPPPPLTDWDSLADRLRAEGLIKATAFGGSGGSGGGRFARRTWMQAAAALLLVAGGAAVGRFTAPASSSETTATQSAQASGPASPTGAAGQAASATTASSTASEFRSPEEAWEVLNRAGEEYQRASAYLSASNTEVPLPTNPDTYRTRLAALDNVMTEMRSALNEAPHDPVINQYYLATVGAREATLRQLGTTLPAGARLNRF